MSVERHRLHPVEEHSAPPRYPRWASTLILTAGAVILNFALPDFSLHLLSGWLADGILALSLAFVWGQAGIFSFGQPAFFGIGGYIYGIIAITCADATGETVTALIGATLAGASHDAHLIAKFSGYRDQQRRQALEETSQRSVMIDSLLHGHNHDAWTLWEIANYLRLPTEGPFVVIAAEVGDVGYEALPEIESKLRSLDVFSAWRLLPEFVVGIVSLRSRRIRPTRTSS